MADFYVTKKTNTYSDLLEVIGLFKLIQFISNSNLNKTHIKDEGLWFAIHLGKGERELLEKGLESPRFNPLFKYLKAKSIDKVPEEVTSDVVMDYELQKQLRDQRYELLKSKKKNQTLEQTNQTFEDPKYDIFSNINFLKATPAHNKLYLNILKLKPAFKEVIKELLKFYSDKDSSVDELMNNLKLILKTTKIDSINALQIFNPIQGKGINSNKANNFKPDNLSAYWPIEWLKVIGIYEAGIIVSVQGVKDRKVYIPNLLNFEVHYLSASINKLKEGLYSSGSVFGDIQISLKYVKCLFEHMEENITLITEPDKLISGFQMCFFKDLGSAHAPSNLSFIHLPTWVNVKSKDDISTFKNIIEEHLSILSRLEENKSDQLAILLEYRDFLSSSDWMKFLDCLCLYSFYLAKNIESKAFIKSFTCNNMEEIFMQSKDKKYSEILQNEGFKNIASAIRKSTRSLLYTKTKQPYDVRYGLAEELVRASKYKEKFMNALNDFMLSFNKENAYKAERAKRKDITNEDIKEIVLLIDNYGSEVIGKMLVAYGYAKEEKEEIETPEENLVATKA